MMEKICPLHFKDRQFSLEKRDMPAVHSRQENLRQGKSKNVDGNTRLALDPLM